MPTGLASAARSQPGWPRGTFGTICEGAMNGFPETMRILLLCVAATLLSGGSAASAAEPVRLDLLRPGAGRGWRALHDLAPVSTTREGLRFRSAGDDPYCESPVITPPAGTPLVLTLRARSATGGPVQVFYYADKEGPTELHSVRLLLPAGEFREISSVLPPLPPKTRLRIDPPPGETDLASIELAPRLEISPPAWPTVEHTPLPVTSPTLRSGAVAITYAPDRWSDFRIALDGTEVAAGYPHPRIAYQNGAEVRWLDLSSGQTKSAVSDGGLESVCTLKDPDGGIWTLRQRFAAGPRPGSMAVEASATCDKPRDLFHLPLLLVCPGFGTHGKEKTQGLFAGVEYLDREPSSSTADISGPLHERRVPIRTKVTFPLMAVQHEGCWTGLVWEQSPLVAPLFDSPDRTFSSESHLLGLVAPGTDLNRRSDGAVYPFRPTRLEANQSIEAKGMILCGTGPNVLPAVQEYVALRGLPELPGSADVEEYVRLAARGWLDSPIRDGDKFRHALPPDKFSANPASDAAWMMDQLATLTKDADLASRLQSTSASAWNALQGRDLNGHRVGHVGLPIAPLLRNEVEPAVERARQQARGLLGRFDAEGRILYQPRGNVDYSRTHWSKEANGLEAQVVAQLLEEAAFAGDRDLIDQGIRRLRGLDRFTNTVPRGAQTWEVPLHTPDILASSHLVRAYVLGYELTGDKTLLESARSWAWTGVPFVYLVNPADQPIGPYATIAVLGATSWEAPLWIGLPVQWCGLCYADALLRLAPHDPEGPWTKLAHGIARSGVQQVYPAGHPSAGLLPDSFTLEIQHRNIFDINPGTLHPAAVTALTGSRPYGFASLEGGRFLIHAAGTLQELRCDAGHLGLTVRPWARSPSTILIHGAGPATDVRRNGERVPVEAYRAISETGSILLKVDGETRIEIEQTPAKK